MSTPQVSVIILSYNRPKRLSSAIEAIMNQSYQNLEIIIGDDCSTDPEVIQVIEQYKAKDERIQFYLQTKNLGIIKHQQWLLKKVSASSEYLLWACDDDDWHADYIRVCVEKLEQHPEAILCSSSAYLKLNGKKIEWRSEDSHTLGMKENHLRYYRVLHNVLWWNHAFYGVIRKEAYELIRLKHRFCFDILFVCQLSLYGEFIKIPDLYITKGGQGIGSDLTSNLKAIKVQNKLVREFPKLAVALYLIWGVVWTRKLSPFQKPGICLKIFKVVKETEMYPNEKRKLIWKPQK